MSGRRSIMVPGFSHGDQPIPAASRVGPLVVTGGIYGLDRERGAIPDDMADQARLTFENLAAIMEAAGGDLGSIARITFHVKHPSVRSAINAEWLRHFPDPESRPARHTLANEGLAANMLLQCDAIGWIAG